MKPSDLRDWHKCLLPESSWERDQGKGHTEALWSADEGDYRGYLTPSCSSTMDVAWALTDCGRFPEMSWLIAMMQTRGRGQLGRYWHSGAGNLLATIRLLDSTADSGPLLSLAVAAIITDVLMELSLLPEIKWPNDILIGGKKAGGILIEEKRGRVLAGIGMNVRKAPDVKNQSALFELPACCLVEFGFDMDAPSLWQLLAERFRRWLAPLLAKPDHLRDKVEQSLAFKEEAVVLKLNSGRSRLAKVLGLDASGALVIQTGWGKKIVRAGKIVPRILI